MTTELITKDDPIPTAHGGPEAPPTAAVTLFGTDDPAAVLDRARAVARALMEPVEKQRLYSIVSKPGKPVKKHLRVEAWTLMGAMVGVFPVTRWTRPVKMPNGDEGWEARCEAVTLNGQVVGSAESMCMRSEDRWKDAEHYAVRSMASTRATSKCLSNPLRFVAVLGGFSGTTAEEIPDASAPRAAGRPRAAAASQREPVEEIPGTDRPFRERDVCPVCALDGNKTSRGGRPAFFVPKQGPHAGQLQCNGRIGTGPDAQWANHPAPLSPQEAATADDNPANEAEIPA